MFLGIPISETSTHFYVSFNLGLDDNEMNGCVSHHFLSFPQIGIILSMLQSIC
jgi:hypothetical protein